VNALGAVVLAWLALNGLAAFLLMRNHRA